MSLFHDLDGVGQHSLNLLAIVLVVLVFYCRSRADLKSAGVANASLKKLSGSVIFQCYATSENRPPRLSTGGDAI